MFICLQQWRLKRLGGTLADIKIPLEEEAQNPHILCKVSILAVFQVYFINLIRKILRNKTHMCIKQSGYMYK